MGEEKPVHYEMANEGDTADIVRACQASLVAMLRDVVAHSKKEFGEKIPGLTWGQVEYLIDMAAKTQPTIIRQEEPQ